MPLDRPRFHINATNLHQAPFEPAVFVLWDGDAPVFVGASSAAAPLRLKILDTMLAHREAHLATHFSYALVDDPERRAEEIAHELGVPV